MSATLRQLGVPIEPPVRDLEAAAAKGFAAASLALGQRALEAGNPEEAIVAFDGAILSLQERRHIDLGHLLAVAHYLRGTAYEVKGLAAQALDDHAMALVLFPDHKGALAARDRLHQDPK